MNGLTYGYADVLIDVFILVWIACSRCNILGKSKKKKT